MTRNRKNDKLRRLRCARNDDSKRAAYRRDYARVIHAPSFRRMQGKTQLFPGLESDFTRNRLTHSLEVAQIAKSIALMLKEKCPKLDVEPDVCEVAGLIHDIGHPPFGHVGEKALDDKMKRFGGFEANAQTLRIVARLEKKERIVSNNQSDIIDGKDHRVGLNLTYRSLLSCIKYWNTIEVSRDEKSDLSKGIYECDKEIIEDISSKVFNGNPSNNRKSIECFIMDIADDIAYSSYDLEDAFKSGILNPLEIIDQEPHFFQSISDSLNAKGVSISPNECRNIILVFLLEVLGPIVLEHAWHKPPHVVDTLTLLEEYIERSAPLIRSNQLSREFASDGYSRTRFFSNIVNEAVNNITVDFDSSSDEWAILSPVHFELETKTWQVAIMKQFVMQLLIQSPSFKAIEYRQTKIISEIFDVLSCDEGYRMMPLDFQKYSDAFRTDVDKKRVICDYIAGMTDRYAIEFHNRILSNEGVTIFRPYY